MRFTYIAILFFFIFPYCSAQTEDNPLQEKSTGNTIYLSHTQYMVTYAGAAVSDIVGVFDPWYATADTTTGIFSFTLTDSDNGTYNINSATGVISISNSAGLQAGWDTLIVKTTLQKRTQSNYVFVKVKDLVDCYFIDPSSTVTGKGTLDSPFKEWTSVVFKEGKAYFQKRGTKDTITIRVYASGINGNEIILGAYGKGNRPIISCGMDKMGMQVVGNYIWFFEYEFNKNQYGIQMESSNAITIDSHCLFSDLTFINSAPMNGMLYFKHMDMVIDNNRSYHKVYDINASCTIPGEGKYGLKIETCNNLVENFRGYNVDHQTISIPQWGWYNIIKGVSSFNTATGVELSGVGNEVSYSYFKDNYRGIAMEDPGSMGSVIRNCVFDGGTGDASIKLRAHGAYWLNEDIIMSLGRDVIIEDNIIKNNKSNAGISVEYAMKNTIIRRNQLYNNYYGVLLGNESEAIDTVSIYYNVLYHNTIDLCGKGGSHIFIYNNTVDGKIDQSGTKYNVARNNFYRTISGSYTSSNNIDIDGIVTSNYFNNYANHDYRLKPTAILAIDEGYELSLSPDIAGTVVPQGAGPDIGAYEYIPLPAIKLPSAPSELSSTDFTEKSISVSWKDNSVNESAFYIKRTLASDTKQSTIIKVSANSTSYTDENLTPGTTFVYSVQAGNEAGTSAKSNVNVASTLSVAESKRVKDGLIAYYNFNYDPYFVIRDLSEFGDQVNLKILQRNSVSWNQMNKLSINSNTGLLSDIAAKKIISAVKQTNAITVELWIKPYEPITTSQSRILTLGNGTNEGIAIEQYFSSIDEKSFNYGIRFQTESTNSAGYPEIMSEKSTNYMNMQQVTYVKDSVGNEALYVNGSKVTEGYRPNGLSCWSDNFYLRFASKSDMSDPWNGALYLAAFYNKALSNNEITKNYRNGPCDSLKTDGMDYQIRIYPNPAVDKTNIEIIPLQTLDFLPPTYVRIQDALGRIYYSEQIFNPNSSYFKDLSVDGMAKGIYFVQVVSGKNQKTAKLLVH